MSVTSSDRRQGGPPPTWQQPPPGAPWAPQPQTPPGQPNTAIPPASTARRSRVPPGLRPGRRGFWGYVGWALLMIVLSPFLVLYGLYWLVTILLTPVLFALHLAVWILAWPWAGVCYMCGARQDAKWRIFRPTPPAFPAIWRLSYWFKLRMGISAILEFITTFAR